MSHKFDGKVVLITGGTAGIGAATSEAFRLSGALVAITSRRKDMRSDNQTACIMMDPINEASRTRAMRTLLDLYHRIDILVNNVGENTGTPVLADLFLYNVNHELQTNLICALHLSRLAAESMRHTGGGVIINISSIKGSEASTSVGYGASKAALVQATKSLAKELAPDSIRVVAVSPGLTSTAMTSHMQPAKSENYRASIALGRFAEPGEIASAILFAAEASYMTGTELVVDGGYKL